MENFASKIKAINYLEKEKGSLNKFMTSLSDEIISLDELIKINEYLKANDIIITKPSQNKIFASGYDYIYEVVEDYKSMGLIKALIEDPVRINSKRSLDRIKYLRQKELPLTKPNGKFNKAIFSKTLFAKEYGIDISEEVKPKEFDPLEANEYKMENKPITNLFQENNELDEYAAVINAPQVPADDDSIKEFDILYNKAEKILNDVYGNDNNKVSVPDNVCSNLLKLTAQKMNDNKKILLYSLTYGKNLNKEEYDLITNKIEEELSKNDLYSNIELESI